MDELRLGKNRRGRSRFYWRFGLFGGGSSYEDSKRLVYCYCALVGNLEHACLYLSVIVDKM